MMNEVVLDETEYTFPNEALNLLMKIRSERLLNDHDFTIISDVIHDYLNLRAAVFHKF